MDSVSTVALAKDWIKLLGGREAYPDSFASSSELAVGHFHFDGLADEVVAPPLPLHYVSVTLGGPLRIEARIDGARIKARVLPGQSMIMTAGRTNAWRWDRPTEEAHVFLRPEFLADTAYEMGAGTVDLLDRMAFDDAGLRQTILALSDEMGRYRAISPLFLDMAADVVARRLLRHCNGSKTPGRTDGLLTARQLRRVLDLVENELGDGITLDTLAQAAGVSRYHFTRSFKAAVGQSPYRWLIGLRIEKAKELLAKGTTTIIEVAAAVGFESQSHFGHVFQARTGMTPTAWRRRFAC